MEQSRLVKYIGVLFVKEKEKFYLFVYFFYFNKYDKIVQFLDVIEKWLECFNGILDKLKVFKRLFLSDKYDEQCFYNVMFYFKKLYYSFLVYC